MKFSKYQALGNDYLVLQDAALPPQPGVVRQLCHRQLGAGADGVLWPHPSGQAGEFAVRIFNPDGSEAETSGNGLRIFARYLWDCGLVAAAQFAVTTLAGTVQCQVLAGGAAVRVQLGRARFESSAIPVAGAARAVVNEPLRVAGRLLHITAVSVGNPHCVVPLARISAALVQRLGPLLEHHALFPQRTNVQLVRVLAAHQIQIEIWERGAGYTLASGSSSCAAAAACVRLGLCRSPLQVRMPGGLLQVQVAPDYSVTLEGPAQKVYEGVADPKDFASDPA
ncbi:MAG: diaminopimelate epimerase [Chloroflexi bacterium]|nr:MAG: diaminopimelate epimerase [Chloroflexota bacterium]